MSSMNRYMHPNNVYHLQRPNFKELAALYPYFQEVSTTDEQGRVHLDFKKPICLSALARALLHKDFGLDIILPLDRLIPTIPLRLNYILWLEDILKSFTTGTDPIRMIDIGAGASCIYPLLGSKKNGWSFVASEKDTYNLKLAQVNIEKNNLQDKITMLSAETSSTLLTSVLEASGPGVFHAVLSNPPFFSGPVEAAGSGDSRRHPPRSINPISREEGQTAGGEVAFVMQLARESVQHKDRVKVFTAMLGKKRSVSALKKLLKKLDVAQISVYEMCQGRVMRWGLGWTFDSTIVFPKSEFRSKKPSERPPLTWAIPLEFSSSSFYRPDTIYEKLKELFHELKIVCLEQKNKATRGGIHLLISATANTWTNQRRRRREEERRQRANDSTGEKEQKSMTDLETQKRCGEEGMDMSTGSGDLPDDGMDRERKRRREKSSSDDERDTSHGSSDDNSDEPVAKQARLGSVCAEGEAWEEPDDVHVSKADTPNQTLEEGPLVKATVWVEGATSGVVTGFMDQLILKMVWIDGHNREAMNQILCFIKNKLTPWLAQTKVAWPTQTEST